jgi:hypothetical protein
VPCFGRAENDDRRAFGEALAHAGQVAAGSAGCRRRSQRRRACMRSRALRPARHARCRARLQKISARATRLASAATASPPAPIPPWCRQPCPPRQHGRAAIGHNRAQHLQPRRAHAGASPAASTIARQVRSPVNGCPPKRLDAAPSYPAAAEERCMSAAVRAADTTIARRLNCQHAGAAGGSVNVPGWHRRLVRNHVLGSLSHRAADQLAAPPSASSRSGRALSLSRDRICQVSLAARPVSILAVRHVRL